MKNYANMLIKDGQKYKDMTSEEKTRYLKKAYEELQLSWPDIASYIGLPSNTIRRQAAKLGIVSRTKSSAQKIALLTEKKPHPTKGKTRSEAEKKKISESVYASYQNSSDEQKAARSLQAKERWDSMEESERTEFRKSSAKAIRKASVDGSKLEKFLHEELVKAGEYVEYHKEHLILNEKLHIDIFIPRINTAIEVDGPSHFEPIWGDKTFRRNLKADSEKAGLLLNKGLILIRVKNTKPLSAKYKRDILEELLSTIKRIRTEKLSREDKFIKIGE